MDSYYKCIDTPVGSPKCVTTNVLVRHQEVLHVVATNVSINH